MSVLVCRKVGGETLQTEAADLFEDMIAARQNREGKAGGDGRPGVVDAPDQRGDARGMPPSGRLRNLPASGKSPGPVTILTMISPVLMPSRRTRCRQKPVSLCWSQAPGPEARAKSRTALRMALVVLRVQQAVLDIDDVAPFARAGGSRGQAGLQRSARRRIFAAAGANENSTLLR